MLLDLKLEQTPLLGQVENRDVLMINPVSCHLMTVADHSGHGVRESLHGVRGDAPGRDDVIPSEEPEQPGRSYLSAELPSGHQRLRLRPERPHPYALGIEVGAEADGQALACREPDCHGETAAEGRCHPPAHPAASRSRR